MKKEEEKLVMSDAEKEFILSWRKGIKESSIIMTPEEHQAHIKKIWPAFLGGAEKARDEGRIVKISVEMDMRKATKEEAEDGIPGRIPSGFVVLTIIMGPKGAMGHGIDSNKNSGPTPK